MQGSRSTPTIHDVATIISGAVLWRLRKKIFKLFGYPGHGTGS
jgi:hypothetical protein